MYLDFYNLKSSPFNVTSDYKIFFESSSHRKALASLMYGIQEKKGIILITGEVGTGKTTLSKKLLSQLPENIKTSLILNPYFSDIQLLQAIVGDFGLKIKKANRLDMINQLNDFLIKSNIEGGNAVLIIDEAQNLTVRQLEQVRLLSNLETATEKLLQIVLVGQPELIDKLNQVNLRQIRQRIFVKHDLFPLSQNEVSEYIDFRLKNCGQADIRISPQSFKIIYKFSAGIPRLINMLCDRALLCGFALERKVLDEDLFRTCIEELE